jgi:hypothetical protein
VRESYGLKKSFFEQLDDLFYILVFLFHEFKS